MGLPFDVQPSDVAERWCRPDPEDVVRHNACRKVERSRYYRDRSRVLLGADTIIAFDGGMFGKPAGRESARRMLSALSGRWHQVITGVRLSGPHSSDRFDLCEIGAAAVTRVRFRDLSPSQIVGYLRSGEWQDKAGAYAIQGLGRALVDVVDGDFENVVGLPVHLIHGLLEEHFSHCRFL